MGSMSSSRDRRDAPLKLFGPPEHDLTFWGLVRGIAIAIVVALILTGLAYLLAHNFLARFFVYS